jgi:hypothetical protein
MNITLTIDRFENDKAILITQEGESILWPKNKLPNGLKEGSLIYFNIFNDEEGFKNKNQAAKDILNEILDTEEK